MLNGNVKRIPEGSGPTCIYREEAMEAITRDEYYRRQEEEPVNRIRSRRQVTEIIFSDSRSVGRADRSEDD